MNSEPRQPDFSAEQEIIRRRGLEEVATEAEAMSTNPRTATYRAFERSLKEAQELGVRIEALSLVLIMGDIDHSHAP